MATDAMGCSVTGRPLNAPGAATLGLAGCLQETGAESSAVDSER